MKTSSISMLPMRISSALEQRTRNSAFPRFVVDDVLENEEYDLLFNEFPDHLIRKPGLDGFSNYEVKPEVEPSELLSENWNRFIEVIRSDATKTALVEVCLDQTMKRYPPAWRWSLRSRLRNPDNYEINLAFSANYAGRYLPPHTDNSYKVLALVLYFAPRGYTGVDEGTQFFEPLTASALKSAVRKYNRLADSRLVRYAPICLLPMTSCNIHNHCLTPEDIQANETWFEKHFRIDGSVSFHSNRIAGFIKTQSSFHAVDMRNSTFEGPRRSLLINLNLRHSLAARLGQSIRTKVLGLSS